MGIIAVGAGDAALSPRKFFGIKFKMWAKFEQNLCEILAKVIKIWAILIRFGQNQNLSSPKTFDLLQL